MRAPLWSSKPVWVWASAGISFALFLLLYCTEINYLFCWYFWLASALISELTVTDKGLMEHNMFTVDLDRVFSPFNISQTSWLSQSYSSTYFNHHGRDTLSPQKVHVSWNSSKIPSRSARITLALLCVYRRLHHLLWIPSPTVDTHSRDDNTRLQFLFFISQTTHGSRLSLGLLFAF